PAPLRTREISTTCGSTARANGPGSVGRMWSTNRGLTGLSAQLARATFPGHDSTLLVGSIHPGISGSSVGLVWTRQTIADGSTTCGNTAPGNGRGWVGRT